MSEAKAGRGRPAHAALRLVSGALLLVCWSGLSGCGYSAQELDAAYREGHRRGIIWCRREDPVEVPELDDELLAEWQRGWNEAASVQCRGKYLRLRTP